MQSRYLGRIPFTRALDVEADALATVRLRALPGVLLGFESEPVVTCGVRAGAEDLIYSREEFAARGFEVCSVERGGQATIHHPGQLVIFPIVDVRALGVRAWVRRLSEVTAKVLRDFGVESEWRESSPGLYTSRGKIMACGIRIRQGFSTHGISINVSNDLNDFTLIRACGVRGASLDRLGPGVELERVFNSWCEKFREAQG